MPAHPQVRGLAKDQAARRARVPRVIFASSNHAVGFTPREDFPVPDYAFPAPDTYYGASKAGVIGMVNAEAPGLAEKDITINAVAPGFIETAMTDVLTDKQKESILARVPAGRLGAPEDIAAAALYLASNEGAYVTGQTLHINGGMAMI